MIVTAGERVVLSSELDCFRKSIDNIDAALVYMLAERFSITKRVGIAKAAAGMPPADPARERCQVARLRNLANSAGLDPDFTEKFLRFIVQEVIQHNKLAQKANVLIDRGSGLTDNSGGEPTRV